MSGLLHRLAQRALNENAPRMRSVAPIPWLATPGIAEAEEPGTPARESAVPQQTTEARRFAPWTESPSAALPEQARAPVAEIAAAPLPQPTEVPSAVAAAHGDDNAKAPPAQTFSAEPRQPLANAPVVPETQSDRPPAVSRSGPSADGGPLTRPVRARRLPAPLISPPFASDEHTWATVGPHIPVGAADGEPATEVHVHIARVELTAVQESAAPQRRSRAARTGQSLDEYLQQRKERLG